MTNRLELHWKLDGFVDEQRYYCSETPIDINNLPDPKIVFAGDVYAYIDTAIDAEKTYYLRIGSLKNGIEKISDEVSVSTGVQQLYRYVRLEITANNGGAFFTAVQEVELSSVFGGVDITNPSMGVTSSSNYDGYPASKILDNDFTNLQSCWVSETYASYPHFVTINLGFSASVKELRIWAQPDSTGSTRAPSDFKIQASSDGTEWIDIQSFSGVLGWVPGTPKVFNLVNGTYY